MSVDLLGMKATSIHQPYSGLIATGAKTIETRGYATKYRGPIVICSTQKWHPAVETDHDFGEGVRTYQPTMWPSGELAPPELEVSDCELTHALPMGVALGIADLVDCLAIVNYDPVKHYDGASNDPCLFRVGEYLIQHDGEVDESVCDQLPRGDFSVGNYGWMLNNFKPFDQPIPVKGQQRIWTVKPSNLRESTA